MGYAALSTTVVNEWRQRRLREIPSVNVILGTEAVQGLLSNHERELVTEAVAETLRDVRGEIVRAPVEGDVALLELTPEVLGSGVRERLQGHLRPSLRRVVNATG